MIVVEYRIKDFFAQVAQAIQFPELTKVLLEGKLLKSYQTECSVNSSGVPTDWIRRYPSTNTATGR